MNKFKKYVLPVVFYCITMFAYAGIISAASHNIVANGNIFTPSTITIKKGDTVTWQNTSSQFIEVSSDPHPIHNFYPPLNIGLMAPSTTKSLTMNDVGSFGYHDHLKQSAIGTIIVQAPATATPTQALSNTPPPTNTQTPIKAGDANTDGKVDGIDFVIWLNHYGQSTNSGSSDADFNSDTKVDGIDYTIWLFNYGR